MLFYQFSYFSDVAWLLLWLFQEYSRIRHEIIRLVIIYERTDTWTWTWCEITLLMPFFFVPINQEHLFIIFFTWTWKISIFSFHLFRFVVVCSSILFFISCQVHLNEKYEYVIQIICFEFLFLIFFCDLKKSKMLLGTK